MDLMYTWALMGWSQKACFLFVFVVSVLTVLRALRLMRWAFHPADGAIFANRRQRASWWARSTGGLAQAALCFTCAGAAAGLEGAFAPIAGNLLASVVYDSLHVVGAFAIALGLCAGLFAAALVFALADISSGNPDVSADATAPDAARRDHIDATVQFAHRASRATAIVLIAAALFEFRPALAATFGASGDIWVPAAAFVALGHLWSRLAPIAAALGFVAWLGVLTPWVASAWSGSSITARRR
jgi:hypothetical protein